MPTNWYTEGLKITPAAGTVLADSGPVTGIGPRPYQITLSAGGPIGVNIQHRNAANDANVSEHVFLIPSLSSIQIMWWVTIENDNERFRVTVRDDATTYVQVSMNAQ